ncbi:ABC transporter permease [Sphingomonas segetis]|jgi:putative ABC transport system permease protein|uniref:ABC transporter permease n=1 Tax=Sphingomonas segetis TaxID=1104779 RepID=UPI0012D33387|nr:ABC transporter permease [Sphingomonas segetis]
MWRNYWTVAVRALAKNRTYSIINIAGLAIGMAACVMILLYIRYEQSYDKWLPDVANTYEFQAWYPHPDEGNPALLQMAAYVTKDRVKKDFPQVVGGVYVFDNGPVFIKDGQASSTKGWLFADDDFLKVVNLPLLAGGTLTAPQTAVITQEEAIKRFGTDKVVGRTLSIISHGLNMDFKIAGVLKNIPKNSSLKADAILRIDFNSFFSDAPDFLTCWGCQSGYVFLKLKPGADVAAMQAQLPAWEKRNIPDEPNGNIRYNAGDEQDWNFVNLQDVHLGKAQDASMTPGNDSRTIATFAIIALLILGMAVVNFTNLATARASQRAREVALRKVLGATRKQLIVQFVAESILISAVAMLIALALVELLVKPFAAFLDADLALNYFGSGGILLPAIALTLIVGIVSGLYPAFFLSRFQPAQVLKANRSAAETPGSGRLRTALVVLQFAVSIGLIICTAVIYGQTVYARNVDPGYKRDHILQVEEMGRAQLWPKSEAIVNQMERIPGVQAVALTDLGVATTNQSNQNIIPPGGNRQVLIGQYNVGEGYLDAMGIKLVAGRWFDANRPADDMTIPYPQDKAVEKAIAQRGVNVVVNQYAARKLGFASPQDAIGKVVKSELIGEDYGLVNITIIGVVGDSRFRSVRTPIEPIMFRKVRAGPGWMMIRYQGDPATIKAAVERQWKQITSDVPFNAKFSEDIVGELYKKEDARAQIFAAFSLLAVIIGCLGLFGLAAFTAQRRTKEIGIRKVLGARTRDIVRLLVWQFSRPVIIANVIAWPIAWWLMRDWLNGFDQRIPLTPVPFLAAGAIALGIAIATVVGHAVKVARANPIHALRYE